MLKKLRGNIGEPETKTSTIVENLKNLEQSTERYIDDQYNTLNAVME